MIVRSSRHAFHRLLGWYPVVVVTGPRQSGKTTLCRSESGNRPYVNLEAPATREAWMADPVGQLRAHAQGAVIDEFQRFPELTSWLQVKVDDDPAPGRWVLTGSQNLAVAAQVSQSLAGRAGHLVLLPPTTTELRAFATAPTETWATVHAGAYPRIYDAGIPPQEWMSDYVATYVSRDVRDVLRVGDLRAFTTFLRLAAGRTAQEVNLASLGSDCGIARATAGAWLNALEAQWMCTRLPRWHRKVTKQAVKAPKLHFFDTGLVCYLLGIRDPEQLRLHPLRGAIFETFVTSEIYKRMCNQLVPIDLFHFRDAQGLEADLVIGAGESPVLVEIKSSETMDPAALAPLSRVEAKSGARAEKMVIYAGDETRRFPGGTYLSWRDIDTDPVLARCWRPGWSVERGP
jgi:predicted AAA+ superfamily ATPase